MLVQLLDKVNGIQGVSGADHDARVNALLDEHCGDVDQVFICDVLKASG